MTNKTAEKAFIQTTTPTCKHTYLEIDFVFANPFLLQKFTLLQECIFLLNIPFQRIRIICFIRIPVLFKDESVGVVYTVELSKQGRSTVGIVITGTRLFIHLIL